MKLQYAFFDFCDQPDPYRGFKQCGLNFSTDKVFSVTHNENTYFLSSRKKTEEHIIQKGFWGDKRIYNVTALVGDNGAGKSTLLHELIRVCTIQGKQPKSSFILVIERKQSSHKDGLVVYTNIENLEMDLSEYAEVAKSYPEFMKKTKIFILDNTISLSDIELFSEFNEIEQQYKYYNTHYDQLYNATTVSSIDYSTKLSNKKNESASEILANHLRFETFQQMRFIFESRNRQKLFDLRDDGYSVPIPEQLTIFVDSFIVYGESGLSDLIYQFLDSNWGSTYLNERTLLVYLLAINNIVNVFLEEVEADEQGYFDEDFSDDIFFEPLIEKDSNIDRQTFDDVIKDLAEKRDIPLSSYQQYIEFNNYIWDNQFLFEKYFTNASNKDRFIYTVRIGENINDASSELDKLIVGFIDRYRLTINYRYYLTFSWGLSSGENNLLHMFTRIRYLLEGPISGISFGKENNKYGLINRFIPQNNSSLVNTEKAEEYFCDTLFLMFDEADLTYHPEWQRQLTAILTAYIPKIITDPYDSMQNKKGCKDIQIFMTTHSPLMLGDFPAGNVLYLRKQDGITIVDENRMVNTFGQNLYTILKDSFYLERTIGEFAHRKITTVIEYINKVKRTSRSKTVQKSPTLQKLASEFEMHKQTVCHLPSGIIKKKLTEELDICRQILYPDSEMVRLLEKKDYLMNRLIEVEQQLAEMGFKDE